MLSSLNDSLRKKMGMYYTPSDLAEQIVKRAVYLYLESRIIENKGKKVWEEIRPLVRGEQKIIEDPDLVKWVLKLLESIKICDNACGEGVFLIAAGKILVALKERLGGALYNREEKRRSIADNQATLKTFYIRQTIEKNLYGVERNKEALKRAKANLIQWLISSSQSHDYENHGYEKSVKVKLNLATGNSLIGFVSYQKILKDIDYNNQFREFLEQKGVRLETESISELNPFHWCLEFPEIFTNNNKHRGFDIIVGNPPYGNILTKREKTIINACYNENENFKRRSNNSAVIFIERSLKLLKPGGILAFLIPNTFIRKDEFVEIRRLLLEGYTLQEIIDVRNPFIRSGVNLEMVVIFVKNEHQKENYKIKISLYNKFERSMDNKVLNRNKVLSLGWITFYYDDILNYLQQLPRLGDFGKFFSAPRPSMLKIKLKKDENHGNAIKGNSIKKYFIAKTYLIEENEIVSKYRKKLNYPLLVLPEVSGIVQATIINQDILPISAIEIWRPNENCKCEKEYLLLILNSSLITYYYHWYVINKSKLTTHLNSTYLERFPFVTTKFQKQIATLGEYMLILNRSSLMRKQHSTLIKSLNFVINGVVYSLFFGAKYLFDSNALIEGIINHIIPTKELNCSSENFVKEIQHIINVFLEEKEIQSMLRTIYQWEWVKKIEGKVTLL